MDNGLDAWTLDRGPNIGTFGIEIKNSVILSNQQARVLGPKVFPRLCLGLKICTLHMVARVG